MEQVKDEEKRALASMTSELYDKTRKMANLQSEIEGITEENQVLEQEFENEIGKKNETNKETGQIINSINNIYNICRLIKIDQGKQVSSALDADLPNDDVLIENLIKKLKESVTIVGDLKELLRHLPQEMSLERYYED